MATFFTIHQASWGSITIRSVGRETDQMYFEADYNWKGLATRFKKKECHGRFDTKEAAEQLVHAYKTIAERHKEGVEHAYDEWRRKKQAMFDEQERFWAAIDNPTTGS